MGSTQPDTNLILGMYIDYYLFDNLEDHKGLTQEQARELGTKLSTKVDSRLIKDLMQVYENQFNPAKDQLFNRYSTLDGFNAICYKIKEGLYNG